MLSSNKYFSIEPASEKERKTTLWVIIGIIFLGLLNIYLAPLQYLFNDVLKISSVNGCPLLTFTGIPCPFCGMGRSFSCLTDLYITRSFYYNPMGPVFYLIFGFVFGAVLILSLKRKKIILEKPARKLWYIPLLFLIIMWVLNILYGHHH